MSSSYSPKFVTFEQRFNKAFCELKNKLPEASQRYAKIFKLLNWKWTRTGGKPPSASQISKTLNSLLNDLLEDVEESGYTRERSIETGRLFVSFVLEDKDTATLKFGLDTGEEEYI